MLTRRECALRAVELAKIRRLAGLKMRRDNLQIMDVIAVRDHLGKIERL